MALLTLDDIVGQVDRLPQLPQTLIKLTRIFEYEPQVDAQTLANVVMVDPNLTSQVLRLCNSAAYGLAHSVDNIQHAVAIIGHNTLRSMVYTIISQSTLNRPVSGYQLEPGELWVNSLTGSVYARHMAEKTPGVDPEPAFTSALLRDLGKIILDEYVGQNYKTIESIAIRERIPFTQAEEQVLGFNHNDVGMRVAQKWNLPESIVMVIRYNHAPSEMPENLDMGIQKLVAIVHLADAFTLMLGAGLGSDGLMYGVDPAAMKILNLDLNPRYIEQTMSELVDQNKVVQSLLSSFK